jgi:hypothetical protein
LGQTLIAGSNPGYALLALLARIEMDPAGDANVRTALTANGVWDRFLALAEDHAMAPLAYHHLVREAAPGDAQLPQTVRRGLQALVLRHRDADAILNANLTDIIYATRRVNLQVLVLKGGALCHLLYPSSSMRPRRDIDLLAHPRQAMQVQACLSGLGFTTPAIHPVRAMRFHHHLPIASRQDQGMQVSVEVHHDALSGDYPCHLRIGQLQDPPQHFDIPQDGGEPVTAAALGHHDMLRHLCLHALEPGGDFRLIGLADIVSYACRYRDELDVERLARSDYGHAVSNTLALLHYLAPLPLPIATFAPQPHSAAPGGVGQNMPTLKQILTMPLAKTEKLKQILFPSPWWMHAYYGVPPGNPLGRVRYSRHLLRVCRWALRRGIAVGLPG